MKSYETLQQEYRTDNVVSPGGHASVLVEQLDELIACNPKYANIGSREYYSLESGSYSSFSYEYLRSIDFLAWPLERNRLTIEHTRFAGRVAVSDMYKVIHDVSILSYVTGSDGMPTPFNNKITGVYYLEAYKNGLYQAQMTPVNMSGDAYQSDIPMSAYDCGQLFDTVSDIENAINADDRDRQRANELYYQSWLS